MKIVENRVILSTMDEFDQYTKAVESLKSKVDKENPFSEHLITAAEIVINETKDYIIKTKECQKMIDDLKQTLKTFDMLTPEEQKLLAFLKENAAKNLSEIETVYSRDVADYQGAQTILYKMKDKEPRNFSSIHRFIITP